MLNIFINTAKTMQGRRMSELGYENKVSDYFNYDFEASWFRDEFVQRIIKEIDDSEVIFLPNVPDSINIYNKTLGNIPPERLSSGCKNLILLYMTDLKTNGDRLGDNCFELLIEIAKKKDINIILGHTPPFPEQFDAYIINTDKYIHSFNEFLDERIDLL